MSAAETLPRAQPPVAIPTPPDIPLPAGAVDTHIHVVAESADFALWERRIEDPAEGTHEDWLQRLNTHHDTLGLERVVVVHSILHGADNAITLASVDRLGRSRARAICLVHDDIDDAVLDQLVDAGCMGVRLNHVHGGILSWAGAKAMAPRLAERGMHIQMLMNAHKHMAELADDVRSLSIPVVFDHLGWPNMAAGPLEPGFRLMRELLAEGHIYVKLSALNRFSAPPYQSAEVHLASLLEANPDRLLWGSDWPHLMLADAPHPDAGEMLNTVLRLIGSAADRRKIFVENPNRLYGF